MHGGRIGGIERWEGEGGIVSVVGGRECCQTWEEGVVREDEVSGQQDGQPSHLQWHTDGGEIQHQTEDGDGEYEIDDYGQYHYLVQVLHGDMGMVECLHVYAASRQLTM